MNFMQVCSRSKRSEEVRWPLKKLLVTIRTYVKSFPCAITFQNMQQLQLFLNSGLHLGKRGNWLLLPLTLSQHCCPHQPGFNLPMRVFKENVFVFSYICLTSMPSLFRTAVRKPVPHRSSVIIRERNTKWITKSVSTKTVWARSGQHLLRAIKAFPCKWNWHHDPRISSVCWTEVRSLNSGENGESVNT